MRNRFYHLLACTVFSCGVCTAAENMLINGDFESGTAPWSASEWTRPEMGKFTFKQVQDNVYAGKYAAEFAHVSGGSNLVLGQHVKISGQQNLLLEFYAKADVRVSTTTQISASIVTVDENNQKLQYELKRFTVGDNWEKFTWQFATHAKTAQLTVYLRCGKERIWFDNAALKKFAGVNMTAVQTYYPDKEVIPTLVSNSKNGSEVSVTIRNTDSKKVLFKENILIKTGTNFPTLKVPGITAGQWEIEVADPSGVSNTAKFVWPAEAPAVKGKLNNFVTVLYPQKATWVKNGSPLKFTNPREGWIYLKLRSGKDAELQLPGSSGKNIVLKANEPLEVMRFAPAGTLELQALNDTVQLDECEIRTMAELIFTEYEGMQSRSMYFDLMAGLPGQTMLKNTNMIMEGFDGAYTMGMETVPEHTAQRIQAYRDSGKQVISHTHRTTAKGGKVKLEDTPEFWASRIGMNEYDGTAIDEFAHETPEELVHYCNAVRKVNANKAQTGKRFYAYSCAAWDTHAKSVEFRKLLLAGSGIFAPEFYLRERNSLGEAKSHINFMFDYLRNWPKSLPGSLQRLVIVLSNTDGLPSYYGQDTFANVQYKYYLDLQYQLLATDPQFKDLRGITAWIIRYSKPETIVWMAMLNRHYCIEGNTDLLSKRLGFDYELPYVKNPDFVDGLQGWKLSPAAEGSIKYTQVTGWGFGRGTCNAGTDGDAVVLFKRVPGKTNAISQQITNLKPGQWYEFSCRVADYDDVTGGKGIRKLMPLTVTISGHTFEPAISAIDTYISAHPMKPLFPTYGKGPGGNELRLFFRAQAPTAELTLSDAGAMTEIKAGNYINAPHATPVKEEIKNMMINFIQIQPVLAPELWHGASK